MKKVGGYVIAICITAVVVAAVTLLSSHHYKKDEVISIIRDTVIVRDTVRIEKPIARHIRTVDTVLVLATDTLRIRDTVFVRLPVEEKLYSSNDYKLQVSGYRPTLDWIEVYPTTVTVKETQNISAPSRKRWGVGVQAGYGATLYNKQVILSPYVGIGISYHFIRW